MRDTPFKSMKNDISLSTVTGRPKSDQERKRGENKTFKAVNKNPCSFFLNSPKGHHSKKRYCFVGK